jgi:hypothetical protein
MEGLAMAAFDTSTPKGQKPADPIPDFDEVWVSKYALSDGIKKFDVANVYRHQATISVSVKQRAGFYYTLGRECHLTEAEAIAQAEKMRDAKIKSLERQASKLRALSFRAAALLVGLAICATSTATAQIIVHASAGIRTVSGALVCPNYSVFTSVMLAISEHEIEAVAAARDPQYARDAQLLRGGISPMPDLAALRCALVPIGTPMLLLSTTIPPVVSVALSDGSSLTGVTHPAMIRAN